MLPKIFDSSFSAVSKRMFASRYSFCNIFKLYNSCALLRRSKLKRLAKKQIGFNSIFIRLLNVGSFCQMLTRFWRARSRLPSQFGRFGQLPVQAPGGLGDQRLHDRIRNRVQRTLDRCLCSLFHNLTSKPFHRGTSERSFQS